MQDFQDHLNIKISGKNHYALIAFLKKHSGNSDDDAVSRFVEEAIVWRILDREMAFRHANPAEDPIAAQAAYENAGSLAA